MAPAGGQRADRAVAASPDFLSGKLPSPRQPLQLLFVVPVVPAKASQLRPGRALRLSAARLCSRPGAPQQPAGHGGAAAASSESPRWRRRRRAESGKKLEDGCLSAGEHTQPVALGIREPLCETTQESVKLELQPCTPSSCTPVLLTICLPHVLERASFATGQGTSTAPEIFPFPHTHVC